MARLFKQKGDVEPFMNNLVVFSPIDEEDLELFLDAAEGMIRQTAEANGRTFHPFNRKLLREVNKTFGCGRCKTIVGLLNLMEEARHLFTTEEETAVLAMMDLAVIPTFGTTPEA